MLLVLACSITFAESRPALLQTGDHAPTFSATDDQGKVWKSEDHVGNGVVVVFFYPADMTSQSSSQCCSFRDRLAALRKEGIKVIGVSGDSVENHRLFKRHYELNFPLLADEGGRIARAFGVPVRQGGEITRVVGGKQRKFVRGVTTGRWTFVIGHDGTIISRNTDVQPEEDASAVLTVVRQFTASSN